MEDNLSITPEKFNANQEALEKITKHEEAIAQHGIDLKKINEILLAVILVLLVAFIGILITLGGYIHSGYMERAKSFNDLKDEVMKSRIHTEIIYSDINQESASFQCLGSD